MVTLVSDAKRRFKVTSSFDPDISSRQKQIDGIGRNPTWSFSVSNGKDEVYVYPNAGQTFVNIQTAGSTMMLSHRLDVKDAKTLWAQLLDICEENIVGALKRCKVKPAGMYYTYKAKSRYLQFSPPDS